MNNTSKVDSHISTELNPGRVSEADIVVGIYSRDNSDEMGYSVYKAAGGLTRYYPDLKGVIVNLDSCSEDDTREVFLASPSDVPKIYVSTPPEARLRKHSFFNLVEIAHRLKAKAIVTFEASTATLKKAWLPRLLEPILERGACFTSPLYSRQHFDLPVTHLLSYPLFRTLFGRRILNPNLGDAAFSGSLNEVFFNTAEWPSEDSFFSIELATAMLAVKHGPVYQSFMGDPRVGKQRLLVDTSLGEQFYEILHSFYELMVLYPEFWTKSGHSRPTPVIGTDLKPEILPPRELACSNETFLEHIRKSAVEHDALWRQCFPGHLKLLSDLQNNSLDNLEVPANEWALLIYAGAARFKKLGPENGKAVIRALIPPFFVRLINFKKLISSVPSGQMRALMEDESAVFEKLKPKLLEAWNSVS
jgi:hypothetical protein